ncbi:beta-lactamase-like protein [Camillea tinctor]|nr:beta-lactamase-like protein [Camillea tinctor]
MSSAVEIPPSTATVSVSIINTGWVRGVPCSTWFNPRFEGLNVFNFCSYAFLVTHDDPETGRRRRVLFDMGIRKDWQNVVPTWQRIFRDHAVELKVEKDVSEILNDGGIDLNDIEAMIWSHLHWDHIGNPAKFPASAKLIVGPGFKEAFMPGFPGNLRAEFKQEDVAGRTIVEIRRPQFDVSVGGFPGYDYFGDGSFYILDAPGHVTGHINALARTTSSPESFVFMAADSVHFGGEFRPSAQLPLPPGGTDLPAPLPCPCPADLLLAMHPHHSRTTPYLCLGSSFPEDVDAADRTIRHLQAFDADARVLVVFAHDESFLLPSPNEEGEAMLPQFPRTMNDWAAKTTRKEKANGVKRGNGTGGRGSGIKEAVRWAFLGDLYKLAMERTKAMREANGGQGAQSHL